MPLALSFVIAVVRLRPRLRALSRQRWHRSHQHRPTSRHL